MEFSFSTFLNTYKYLIIGKWVEKLHTECGEQYAARPLEELFGTITRAVDANYQVLAHGNYHAINIFIDKITDMRLKAGFALSDVQRAFELYRMILTDILISNAPKEEFQKIFERLNHCLAYTMHRFSDHFQDMHQKKIIQQNRELEQMVKKRTAAFQESEKKYKTLVEEINDGYFVIQDAVIVFANKAFCNMHGYDLQDVLGKNFCMFVAASDREAVLKIYSDSSDRKVSSQVFEYKRLAKSNQEFSTEIQGKTTSYDNKISSIGICRDITERVKMEKKVLENERMAYIGHITASLSHEIRNPLSAIKMNLQILKGNQKIMGNDKRRIDISVSEVIRLEQILNQLLAFAKPLQMNIKPCNICHILKSYIELLEMKFKEKDLMVTTTVEDELPPLKADGDKLGQAFINILNNAIESSDPFGKISVTFKKINRQNIEYAAILIDDEGHGFDEKDKEKIFKPFFTKKTKGVGLGLANVKRIIDAHNGFVSAQKKESKGALFLIMLPLGNI
ncbi:MAG: PAS domain S-box protein [Proteobacteria bacterium]|nr:PAS domain S-box protein [Pseudomonadota bacterium]